MGIDFLIDEYPLYSVCALIDGAANLLSPAGVRIIQLTSPESTGKPHRIFQAQSDHNKVSMYRPLGSQAGQATYLRDVPDDWQEVVIVDGRLIKRSIHYPGIHSQVEKASRTGGNSLWALMDDRDFNHILRGTFECGLPFRLYIKRERVHPRAAHVLLRRGIHFLYSSYAVCAEHFTSLPENGERNGVYFSGELSRPYHTDRKRLLSALATEPSLKHLLSIPDERQSVENYFAGLRSSLVGLDLPAGGKITPRRYEVPACGAVLLTTNRVNWLPDDPLQVGLAVFAPPSVEGVRIRLQELLADPSACRQLGEAGRQHILAHHTTTRRAEALFAALESYFQLRLM